MSAVTLLNAAASTGAGSILFLPHLVKTHAVQLQATTGSPTTVTIALEGSLDGVVFFILDTATYTTVANMNFAVDKPVNYVRLNLTTLSGGTAPTVTAIYEGGRQSTSTIGRRGQF